MLNILLVEPFYTGSHASWANGIIDNSCHNVSLLKMPGRNWKWRMHGGAVTLAREFMKLKIRPDLIVATDMIDLSVFLSLTRDISASIPAVLYFHENQLNYPWSPTDRDIINRRDMHYSFINYTSALSADFVLFNSEFHLNSFINELPRFLRQFPDYNEFETVEIIKEKSRVLPLGIDLSRFDRFRGRRTEGRNKPVILWNHRWEYDKNPGEFFDALYKLQNRGIDFDLVILGENFRNHPSEFEEAKTELDGRILKFGYAESFEEYSFWLWNSDILPVTSNQDFFGISIMEAVFCGNIPLLPERLAYPELFPQHEFAQYYYRDNSDFVSKLETFITEKDKLNTLMLKKRASKFDWKNIIDTYDGIFEEIVEMKN